MRTPKYAKGDNVKIFDIEYPLYIEGPVYDENNTFTGEYECSRKTEMDFTEMRIISEDLLTLIEKPINPE